MRVMKLPIVRSPNREMSLVAQQNFLSPSSIFLPLHSLRPLLESSSHINQRTHTLLRAKYSQKVWAISFFSFSCLSILSAH